jgi:hypothetical protein
VPDVRFDASEVRVLIEIPKYREHATRITRYVINQYPALPTKAA